MSSSSNSECTMMKVAEGVAAGLAGTVVIWSAQAAIQKLFPSTTEPMKLEPGMVIARKVHNQLPARTWGSIPHLAEKSFAQSTGFMYGGFWGALFAALRPKGSSLWIDGLILGIICWAAGYLGWLPASGIMPPVWRQKPRQALPPVATHAMYGLATAGAYDWLREHV